MRVQSGCGRSGGRAAVAAVGLLLFAGCSQGNSYLARRTTIGTLKANVAELEHDNEKYRKQVAELQQKHRVAVEDLSQERAYSEELTARLDKARTMLGREGLDDGGEIESASRDPRPSRTTPVGQPGNGRKAPFAQIGGLRAVPHPEDERREPEPEPTPSRRRSAAPTESRQAPTRDGEPPMRWLPVAVGAVESPTPKQ